MDHELTPTIVLIIEIGLYLALATGRSAARRLNIDLHHKLIYSVLTIQLIVFLLWMLEIIGDD